MWLYGRHVTLTVAKSGNNCGKGWDKQLQRVGNPVYSTIMKTRKVQFKKKTVYGQTVAKSGTKI